MPSGKFHPFFPHDSVVALGQLHDEVVGVGGPGRLFHLGRVDSVLAVGDVLPHREIEQERILGHDADVRAQAGQGEIVQGVAVQQDFPLPAVVEAGDELHQRRLARSALAHKGHALTRLDFKIYVLEGRFLGAGVIEGNVPKGQGGKGRGVDLCAACFFLQFPGIKNFKDPFRSGHGLLDGVVGLADGFEGVVEHDQSSQEGEELSGRAVAGDDLAAAVPDDQARTHRADQFHNGRRELVVDVALQADLDQIVAGPAEFFFFHIFGREGLDHAQPVEAFLQVRGDVRDLGLVLAAHLAQFPTEIHYGVDSQGKDQAGPEGEFGVAVNDQAYKTDHGQRFLGDADEFRKTRADQVHVVYDARHEHAHPGLPEEVHRQADDLGEQLVAQTLQHLESAIGHEEFLGKEPHPLGQEYADQKQRDEQEGGGVFVDKDFIERGLHQIGRAGRTGGDDGQAAHGQGDVQFVGHEVAQASLHELECAVLRVGHVNIRRRIRVYTF